MTNKLTIWAQRDDSNTYVEFNFNEFSSELKGFDSDFTYYQKEMDDLIQEFMSGKLIFSVADNDYEEEDQGLMCPLFIELEYLDGFKKIIRRGS